MKLKNKVLTLGLGFALTLGTSFSIMNLNRELVNTEAAAIEKTAVFDTTKKGKEFTVEDINVSFGEALKFANPWRVYQNNTVKVSGTSSSVLISKIKIGINTGKGKIADTGTNTYWTPNAIASSTANPVVLEFEGTNSISYTASNSQVRWSSFEVTYSVDTSSPSISIENAPTVSLDIGDKGTLNATTANITNPVVTWSSLNEDVATIDSASGEYTAIKSGTATLVASLTGDELTEPITATTQVYVNYGLVTIAEANNIAAPLGSTETAKFTLTVRGYITKLDVDGKNRMLQISDKKIGEEGANSINVFGIFSDNAMRKYIILNGEITFTGKPAKFKDAIQIASPSLVEYTDEAIKFATAANLALDSECAALDVKEETWNTIQGSFNGLDEYAQAKLKAATSKYEYNEEIQDFVARYDLIVAKYNYANFMSRVVSSARVLNATQNSSNNLMITIIMISFVVTLSAGYFFIRKKKAK